jgi:hypothetical protein
MTGWNFLIHVCFRLDDRYREERIRRPRNNRLISMAHRRAPRRLRNYRLFSMAIGAAQRHWRPSNYRLSSMAHRRRAPPIVRFVVCFQRFIAAMTAISAVKI